MAAKSRPLVCGRYHNLNRKEKKFQPLVLFINLFFGYFTLWFVDVMQDNPVGTGYSFVEDSSLFVETDDEAATDLTTLLIEICNRNENLQKSPLFIVAESYGGKYAVTLGLSALKAIEAGKLKLRLGGN